jgi:DNA-binding IclR family transcriptional regulator
MESTVTTPGVIDKALLVLSSLESGPRSLSDLVDSTGLPRATAHRMAVALEAHGLVVRDPQGRFCLGYRLLALARAAARSGALRAVALPVLAALRDSTGESAQLYVRDGDVRVCVVSLDSPNELRTIVEEGARLPLDRGSAGKVLADDWDPADGVGWVASAGERQAGVASVSAPVMIGAEVVAAVGISGPIERIGDGPGARFGEAVLESARQLGELVTDGPGRIAQRG